MMTLILRSRGTRRLEGWRPDWGLVVRDGATRLLTMRG
jgi:hypothetical protein